MAVQSPKGRLTDRELLEYAILKGGRTDKGTGVLGRELREIAGQHADVVIGRLCTMVFAVHEEALKAFEE